MSILFFGCLPIHAWAVLANVRRAHVEQGFAE